jgi:ubiquinone/menaquinone biosynthesis C-methylase UbiE
MLIDTHDAPERSIVFDQAADYYDQTRGLPAHVLEQIGQLMTGAIGKPAARVLEAGVGTGRIALPVLGASSDELKYIGIDLSVPMMRKLQEKIAHDQKAESRLQLIQADAMRLPFADKAFDAVIEVHVLQLIPRWRAALKEMRRVMRTNGVFLHAHASDQHNDAEAWSPWIETRSRWRAILREMNYHSDWAGVKTDRELLDALRGEASTFEELPAIRWTHTDSFRRVLRFIAAKQFSDTWRVPEDIFLESLRRLEAWMQEAHPDMDREHSMTRSYTVFSVRF